jgi:hypothetical protein
MFCNYISATFKNCSVSSRNAIDLDEAIIAVVAGHELINHCYVAVHGDHKSISQYKVLVTFSLWVE